jgi:glycosyltransferase involved in cell wall biosynthesis
LGRASSGRPAADGPLVSVVTVSLNAAGTIAATIESVLGQCHPNIEYLVIDGGSTDGTLDRVRHYDDRIDWWISEPDTGVSDAFNKGIAGSRGEIIGILNAGDWYEPDTISAVVEAFASRPAAGVVCGWLQYWESDKPTYVFRSAPAALWREMTVNHPTMFVRRKVYEDCGLFRTDFGYAMDYELALRLASRQVRFHSLDRVLAHMRAGGITTGNWRRAFLETKLAKLCHGQGQLPASAYFWFQIIRWRLRSMLERVGLDGLVRAYRAHWAALRKTAGLAGAADDREG